MDKVKVAIIIVASLLCLGRAELPKQFPKGFMFGTGTSAYQTEGAWNKGGKSETIWDRWIHTDPSHIKNNDTADVADDSYHVHILDILNLLDLKVQHYRMSIPWSRILPNGFGNEINAVAISHYQLLIKILHAYKITPVVTLYYHDLPQSLQDIGGWTNPEMAKYFANYARICFQYFGDVDYWITFNDPSAICRKGYGEGTFAPGIASDGSGEYLCAYTILKAHAAAYHLYQEEFTQLNGKISIAIDMKWSEPASTNDTAAAERRNSFDFGLYANPIYKGNWPDEVIKRIGDRSKNENFTHSRLPEFTKEEISYINGTSDYMAINLYQANVVEDTEEAPFDESSYMKDMKAKLSLDPTWSVAENGQPIVPEFARKTLVWLKNTYDNPEIFITENGVPDSDSSDTTRISYLRDYLNAILDAITEDGVNVIGYTAWSLLDCFEWTDGYSYNFGFYSVDFESPDKTRIEKDSVKFYKQLAQTRYIPEEQTTTTSPTNPPSTTTDLPETTTPDSAEKVALCSILTITALFLVRLLF